MYSRRHKKRKRNPTIGMKPGQDAAPTDAVEIVRCPACQLNVVLRDGCCPQCHRPLSEAYREHFGSLEAAVAAEATRDVPVRPRCITGLAYITWFMAGMALFFALVMGAPMILMPGSGKLDATLLFCVVPTVVAALLGLWGLGLWRLQQWAWVMANFVAVILWPIHTFGNFELGQANSIFRDLWSNEVRRAFGLPELRK